MRVESQADEIRILSLAYEAFNVQYDNTTVDQKNQVVELHRPDGKPDMLQQIEHGALSVVAGTGRLTACTGVLFARLYGSTYY